MSITTDVSELLRLLLPQLENSVSHPVYQIMSDEPGCCSKCGSRLVGHLTPTSRPMFNEGCLPLKPEKIELMFVTLDKREGFSECVQYHDYAISPELFHWQTQNRASPTNDTGRRYLDSAINGWRFQLFVREDASSAYVALGPVVLEQYEGSQPISITWKLKVPMPVHIFKSFSVLRG